MVQGQPDLLTIVLALRPASGLASLVYGWKQKRNQDADDGNHYQQFDQRKTTTSAHNLGSPGDWV
jgi:hypothetical protein